MSNISKEAATEQLLASLGRARSRRSLLKGAVAATGAVAGAGALSVLPAFAKMTGNRSLAGVDSPFKFNRQPLPIRESGVCARAARHCWRRACAGAEGRLPQPDQRQQLHLSAGQHVVQRPTVHEAVHCWQHGGRQRLVFHLNNVRGNLASREGCQERLEKKQDDVTGIHIPTFLRPMRHGDRW